MDTHSAIPGTVTVDRPGAAQPMQGGATFTMRHRIQRLMWTLVWLVFAAWTPSFFWPWRGFILRAFGAKIHPTAIVRSSVRIWWPTNLSMEAHSSLGPGVICYNVAPVSLGAFATISQRAHLCTGTHDIDDPNFPLRAKPIRIGAKAWVAAEAFVGPGVSIGEGAVLGARSVAFRDLKDWTVSVGNPVSAVKMRQPT